MNIEAIIIRVTAVKRSPVIIPASRDIFATTRPISPRGQRPRPTRNDLFRSRSAGNDPAIPPTIFVPNATRTRMPANGSRIAPLSRLNRSPIDAKKIVTKKPKNQ